MRFQIDSIDSKEYPREIGLSDDLTKITLTFKPQETLKNKEITIFFDNISFNSINNLQTNKKTCNFPDYEYISENQ